MNIIKSLIQKAKDFFFSRNQRLTEEKAIVCRQGLCRVKSKDDGNCFYYSIAATLNAELGREQYTQQQLRDKVGDFWLQQIRCDGKYLRVFRLAVIKWLDEFHKVNTDNPSKQHMLTYIDEIKTSNRKWAWANESAVLALALSLDRPIITLVTACTNANELEIYNKSGVLGTQGLPIFVYYNKHNHYDALLVQPGFKLVEIVQNIYPNWQTERESSHSNDDTISVSSSEDESVCSADGGKQRQIKKPIIINNKKRLLSQDEVTSTTTINSKKLKQCH